MKRALALLAVTILMPAHELAKAANRTSPVTTPDNVLRAYVDSGRVPGVVAVAAAGGRVVHQAAFGMRDAGTGQPMRLDSLFRIASMTKPVTSVAVMQLVEQGRLELDASVARYLPELAHPQVLEGFDPGGQPRLRVARRPPTLRELLANTSGYAYSIWNEDLRRYEAVVKIPWDRSRYPRLPLASDPGTRWEYSPSTAVLGQVVEAVSGLTLEAYFRRHIFEPLGMNDTFYQAPSNKWERLTRVHRRRADGVVEPGPPSPPSPPVVTSFAGDGGLLSTAPDYLRFVQALLNGGELDGVRVLQSQSVGEMCRNQIGGFRAGEMKSFAPDSSFDVHLFPGATNKFGLGFLINTEPVPGGRAAGSLMWAGIFNTYFWVDRQNRVGGVVLTQLLPFADPTVLGIVEEYERAIYSLPR